MRLYLAWCAEHDAPSRWPAPASTSGSPTLLDGGAAAATARARQLAVRRFAAWLAEEGEIAADPFLGVKSPKLDERVVEPLTDDELRALLKACAPPRAPRRPRRCGTAATRPSSGSCSRPAMRAGEVVALELDDVDLAQGTATVRRGKGGKGRVVPFGPDAVLALDRYLRLRRGHRLAALHALGSATAASGSPTTRCTRPSRERADAGRHRRASTRTSCATPPPTAGSPPAAPRPG